MYWPPKRAGDGSFCALIGKGARARHGRVGAVVLLMAVPVVCWSLGGGGYGGGEGGQWDQGGDLHLAPSWRGRRGRTFARDGCIAALQCGSRTLVTMSCGTVGRTESGHRIQVKSYLVCGKDCKAGHF